MSHRRRRRIALVTVVGLAVAASTLGQHRHHDSSGEASSAPQAEASNCLATQGLDTVEGLDHLATTVRGLPEFQGGDVGASVELGDGRQLFMFGDTIRSTVFDARRLVRNSMLVFSPGCARAVVPPDQGAVIPDRADGVGYWPMSVGRVSFLDYDLVAVSAQRVRNNGDTSAGVFAFDILGPAAALFLVRHDQAPQLLATKDLGPDLVDTTRPIWGAATAVDGDWVYLYGTARPPDGAGGFSLRVARTRIGQILDQGTWEYWNGRRWTRRASSAAELIPSDGGVSQTLSVFQAEGHWYALSKQNEVLGTDLTVWTSPEPTGPFTASPALAHIPSDAVTGTLRYLPLAHPDLLPEPGTVVVSYSQNNTDVSVVNADPRLYRPRFLRIDLPEVS